MREHLKLSLNEEGYNISTAVDGPAALELLARGTMRDRIFSLPITICQTA